MKCPSCGSEMELKKDEDKFVIHRKYVCKKCGFYYTVTEFKVRVLGA